MSSNSFAHRFKIDLILILILIGIAVCVLLHHFPVTFSTTDKTGTALMPQQLGHSGVLFVLPDNAENASSYPGMDFSFAWYNLLSQYVGSFSIVLAGQIQSAVELQSQLIVVPQRTAQTMSEAQIQYITQAVQKGAVLIVEMPSPEWAPLTAIKRNAKANSSIKHLTDAPNSPLTGQWRDHLLNTPLDTQIMRLDALDSETLPPDALLLELDGAIAHYRRSVGAGYVFVLAFNLGQALTSMQQGRPSDGFVIETEEPPKTSELVLNEKLLANTVPYADLLKMHLLSSVLAVAPMPLIWPFPNGGKSALILAHETGSLGDSAFKLADYEQSFGVQSTWLTTAGQITRPTLEKWKKAQFDIGVSLLRPPAGRIFEFYGPSFFHPVAVERSMLNQRKAVSRWLGASVSSCRIATSLWSQDYTVAFRKLAAAQCQIDLSYGPTEPEQFGYLYGSGFPYLPIERNGMPLPTYEFPMTVNDEVGLETLPPHAALKLLTEAESTWHEPMVVHFNADTMLTHPSYVVPETWLELLQYAHDNQIWVTSAKAFMHYFTLRKQSQVYYAFHAQSKVLDVQVSFPEASFAYTMAVPRRTQAGSVHDIWIDKRAVDLTTLKTTGDGLLTLIPVTSGDHLVQVQYN